MVSTTQVFCILVETTWPTRSFRSPRTGVVCCSVAVAVVVAISLIVVVLFLGGGRLRLAGRGGSFFFAGGDLTLGQDGLTAGDVALVEAEEVRFFKLPGGLLDPEMEKLLLEFT